MSADLVMRDEVAVVTMTGPRGNPLNEETCAALIAAIADAIGRECRGLVLAGGDGIFSAGGDLAMLRAIGARRLQVLGSMKLESKHRARDGWRGRDWTTTQEHP